MVCIPNIYYWDADIQVQWVYPYLGVETPGEGTLPNGQRQVVGSVQMQSTTGTNQGFIGQFDGDIAQVAGTNAIILDPITVLPSVEEYTILHVANGGLAVRTV